jgi:hypothetical protein
MKGGYNACLGFQPINVIMNDSNQLNKFWMSCSPINQKGMQDTSTFQNDILSFKVPKPY